MFRRTETTAVALAIAALVAACTGAGASPAPTAEAIGGTTDAAASPVASPRAAPETPSPSPAPTKPRITLVRGLPGGGCTTTSYRDETTKTSLVMYEHFTCTGEASDPRVSGVTELDIVTTFEPPDSKAARFVATGTLTNAGGSWKGRSYGGVIFWPDGTVGAPLNVGIDTWRGQGAYKGLVYKDFIAGDDASVDVVGYIRELP